MLKRKTLSFLWSVFFFFLQVRSWKCTGTVPQLDPEHCSITVMDSSRWWRRSILARKSGCKVTLVGSQHCYVCRESTHELQILAWLNEPGSSFWECFKFFFSPSLPSFFFPLRLLWCFLRFLCWVEDKHLLMSWSLEVYPGPDDFAYSWKRLITGKNCFLLFLCRIQGTKSLLTEQVCFLVSGRLCSVLSLRLS